MKRLLLSLLTIGAVSAAATGATVAFFTSTDTLATSVNAAGPLILETAVTTTGGSPDSLFANSLLPGKTVTKCLWINNDSNVPARFKLYRTGPDTGNGALGDATKLSFTLNPTVAGRCGDLSDPFADNQTKYGANDYTESNWSDIALRSGIFDSEANTPVKFLSTYTALDPNTYVVFAVDIKLDEGASNLLAGQTYNTPLTLFGMQKEGSDPGQSW